MPRLADAATIAAIKLAFDEAKRFGGIVTWKLQATQNVFRLLPGYTPERIEELIRDHLACGGAIKFAKEERDEWLDCGFHYDFVLEIPGEVKIYVETVLVSANPADPRVHLVNCHPAN